MIKIIIGLLALGSISAFAQSDYIRLESGVYFTTDENHNMCIYTISQSADKRELYVAIGNTPGRRCRYSGSFIYWANNVGADSDGENFYRYGNFGIGLISKDSLYLGSKRGSEFVVLVKQNTSKISNNDPSEE